MKKVMRSARLSGAGEDFVLTNFEDRRGDYQAWLTDLAGWFGGVGVEADATQRTLGHGVFRDRALRTGRALTLSGQLVFRREQDRSVADRFLSGILWDGEYGSLTVTIDDLTLSAEVRLDGEPKLTYEGGRFVTVQIPLLAPEPFLYAAEQVYQIYPAGAGEGLVYPLLSPEGYLSFGKVDPNTKLSVTNGGNATAYPVIRVKGDLPSGFRITAGGRTVEYNAPVWEQAPVEVNCAEGAVYVDGMDQTYRCSKREWFEIPSGGVLSPSIHSIQEGDGWAEFAVRDTYI